MTIYTPYKNNKMFWQIEKTNNDEYPYRVVGYSNINHSLAHDDPNKGRVLNYFTWDGSQAWRTLDEAKKDLAVIEKWAKARKTNKGKMEYLPPERLEYITTPYKEDK